jgi:DNA-binding transcriptional MocR family regulator
MGTVSADAIKRSTRAQGKLYERLADDLRAAIQSGRLPPGAVLPSLRECATQRAVSLNTATTAYRLLEDQGLIAARPQSGFYVCSVLAEPARPLRASPASSKDDSQDALLSAVLDAQHRPEVLDLALACPRGSRFYPGQKLARLTSHVLRRRSALVSSYALPPGPDVLRKQIVKRARRLGMDLAADDIILAHGAMESLHLALRAVMRAGDCVGIEAPTYVNLYPLISSLGLKAIEIPTHPQSGLDLDAVERLFVEKRLRALIAMPTVHNPLGCTMPLASKQRLARLVRQHKVPLIEDIVYAELQFADIPEPTVKSFDKDGWVLVCSGFSKTLAPDYRQGWMEAGRYAEDVRRLKFSSSGSESAVLGEAVGRFLESGNYEHHLKGLRRLYETQVSTVRGLIARYFPAGTRATRPVGGFLLWVEFPPGVDSVELFHAALAKRLVIMPGRVYSKGTRYRHCIRLSCCREIDDAFVSAIQTIGRLAQQLIG